MIIFFVLLLKFNTMKTLIFLLFLFMPFFSIAQKTEYAVTSFLQEGPKAPNTHYIGEAWLNTILQGNGELNFNITKATFRKNSTLDWHKHSTPQVLIILEGEGYYQERDGAPIIIKKGDVIKCRKDIEHWHTSTKENLVTYLAIYDGSQPTIWTEKLTQEYYDNIAQQLNKAKK